jgi:glycosyltransferase involved in cell wall biosynthesis
MARIMENKKIKILLFVPNEGGCSQHRMILPFKKMEELHGDEIELRWEKNPLGFDNETKKWEFFDPDQKPYTGPIPSIDWADIVMTVNISNYGGPYTFEVMRQAKQRGKITHWDTDDLLINIYEGHRLKQTYVENGLEELSKHLYGLVDLVSVTQEKFASYVAPYATLNDGKLVIIKNCLDLKHPSWNVPKVQTKNLCKFGWVGGIHHDVDVKHVFGVFSAVNQKVGLEKVFWGLYGKPRLDPSNKEDAWQLDVWKGYEAAMAGTIRGKRKNYKIYPALPTDQYGQFYSNIDVSIAPLDPNQFNMSKSNIKAVEAGAYGIPLIASNVGDYDTIIKHNETGILISPDNPKSEWIRQLSRLAKDKKLREELGKNLQEVVRSGFDLNTSVTQRLNLYKGFLKREKNHYFNELYTEEEEEVFEDLPKENLYDDES